MMMLKHEERMIQARMRLVMKKEWAFFGSLGLRLGIRASDRLSTIGVDGRFITYNPAFVEKLSFDELVGVIAHEIMHCAAGHPMRLGKRDFRTFNEACDYAINPLILAAGLTLPPDGLIDSEFEGKAAEDIYSILYARKARVTPKPNGPSQGKGQGQGQKGDGDPQPGDGDGSSGDVDDGGDDDGSDQQSQAGAGADTGDDDWNDDDSDTGDGADAGDDTDQPDDQQSKGKGGDDDAKDDDEPTPESIGGCGTFSAPTGDDDQPLSQAQAEEIQREWDEAVAQAVAVAKKAGNMPGQLLEMFEEVRAPYVDWREQLRRFVDTSAKQDYTWIPPNRRHVAAGLYLPALTNDGIAELVYAVDTSISMNTAALQCATDELNAIIDDVKPERVTVLFADTEVRKVEEYGPDDYPIKVTAYGRGGTAFSPTFAKVEELGITPACLVYFTDLECSDFGPEPNYPVLWAATNPEYAKNAPWGEVINVVIDK